MCKILGIVDVKNGKEGMAAVRRAFKPMTKTDDDGYGYATLGPEGIGVEKWMETADAFKTRPEVGSTDDIVHAFGEIVEPVRNYATSGKVSPDPWAIMAHARWATCDVSLANTHPFHDTKNGLALIHNGVISNHHTLEKRLSTCDSEAILSAYLLEKMEERPDRLQDLVDRLSGSFACMIMSEGGHFIDIFKNGGASLFVTHAPGVGFIFATTEEIAKAAGKGDGPVFPVLDNVFTRYDLKERRNVFTRSFTHAVAPPVKISTFQYGEEFFEVEDDGFTPKKIDPKTWPLMRRKNEHRPAGFRKLP